MISMLRGKLVQANISSIIIDVHGVGYSVFVPNSILTKAPQEDITVFTHTHVREDVLELYGFNSYEELSLFEQLISVSGVGCKSALGIFSIGSRSEIVSAIMEGDAAFFTGVPRLGKKNAQKIIIELKNKIGSTESIGEMPSFSDSSDIIQTLQALGFSQQEARAALQQIPKDGLSTEAKLKQALKQLSR